MGEPAPTMSNASSTMTVNSSAVARQALRQLAAQKIPPTPENYARVFFDIASPGTGATELSPLLLLKDVATDAQARAGAGAADCATLATALDIGDWNLAQAALRRLVNGGGTRWGGLMRDLVHGLDARSARATPGRKREALQHVLTSFGNAPDVLFQRLRGLVDSWAGGDAGAEINNAPLTADAASTGAIPIGGTTAAGAMASAAASSAATAIAPVVGAAAAPAPDAVPAAGATDTAEQGPNWATLGELLALTLTTAVADRAGDSPSSVATARRLAHDARQMHDAASAAVLIGRVRELCIALELRNVNVRETQNGLLRVVHALTTNVAEMLGDDKWLQGQFKSVAELASAPFDQVEIASIERALREIVYKQGVLKKSVDDARNALRAMTVTFIDRLAGLAADAGEHSERLGRYAAEIDRTQDLGQLSNLVVRIVQDTRGMQTDYGRTHEELLDARKNADEYEHRVSRLEHELGALSDRLHEDQLTELLNRRGLDRQFDIEISRAERSGQPLCVCLLDIDDFKRINDTHGHQVGDQALVHLSNVLRQAVRPSDVVARYGGEEFVILLPATRGEDAESVMARVQRELTRRYFLHNHERLLVTFSAGVTERAEGELPSVLMERADRALYRAKELGKNRVVVQ